MSKQSQSEEILIKNIVTRFLKPKFKPEQFKNLKEILDLPITTLKDIGYVEAAQIYHIFGIDKIKELAQLDPLNPAEALLPQDFSQYTEIRVRFKLKIIAELLLEEFEDYEVFRNHVAISKMISRAWEKKEVYLKKKETKMICVGLDNAGKTAILTSLGGKLGISDLTKLKPTRRVERKKISTATMDLFVWDMGGQADYRRDYLAKPENYFMRTDMVLYVIDMQDPARYDESFEYLKNILDIMKMMGENPYILAFMHKSDPDILDDPEFQVNCEYVADKLNFLLNQYDFEFDIYTTSIFNFFTSEPKFSKFIKETLSDKESLNNPVIRKIEGLGEILDNTLNAIVTLANSLGEQIYNLNLRMDTLEQKMNEFMAGSALKAPLISQSPNILASNDSNTQNVPSNILSSDSSTKPPITVAHRPKQIIYTKKNLGLPEPIRSSATIKQKMTNETSSLPPDDTRLQVLLELQGLFQAKRTLDQSTPLNKLGSLGKKIEKIKRK
ncbi:MAG: ADP-ribosylation factor-like protein [Promethearchaeota archaeon]